MHTRNLGMIIVILFTLGIGTTPANAQTAIHVDDDALLGGDGTTWDSAYRYLQDGLAVASGGMEIHVAGGTYTPDKDEAGNVTLSDHEATFQLVSGVAVRGGYRGCPGGDCGSGDPDERNIVLYETTLSGDLNANDVPVESDCCSAHSEPGCDDTVCETTVCGAYPVCCSDPWSESCAGYVVNLCPGLYHTSDENSHHVVTGSGTDKTAVLDGVTITAGTAIGLYPHNNGAGMYNAGGSPILISCTFRHNTAGAEGGGMYNSSTSSPELTDCTFIDNTAGTFGGGMGNSNSDSALTDCTFSGNSADSAGGMYNDESTPKLINGTFNGNSASDRAGGMYNIDSTATLINCTFMDNTADHGAGMFNLTGSSSTLTKCTFSGNTASDYGGGIYSDSSLTVTGCTFMDNTGTWGGGLYQTGNLTLTNCRFMANTANVGGGLCNKNTDSSPMVTNCTFSGNSATSEGGGIYNWGASYPTVVNSILWGNTDGGGTDESAQIHGGPPVINHCCVQGWLGGLGGTGNHGDDPAFVDVDGNDDIPGTQDDNLRLTLRSHCIDTADNDAAMDCNLGCSEDGDCVDPVFDTCYTDLGCCGIGTDLDGNPRIVNGDSDETPTVDMGAYEYQGSCQSDEDCDDGDLCTEDVCDPRLGVCRNVPIECDAGAVCVEGECVDRCAAVDCDDHYSCTKDTCDPQTGICTNAPIECDPGEMCIAGECVREVCEFMDTDGDADIDLADFAMFQNCMSGPG